MRYHYTYQNSGHPLLSWKDGPPRQTRGADAASLGSLGDPTLVLPRPGAPEPINGLGDCGCGCKGAPGGCGRGSMSGVTDTIAALPTVVKVGGAIVLAYLLHKHLKKR